MIVQLYTNRITTSNDYFPILQDIPFYGECDVEIISVDGISTRGLYKITSNRLFLQNYGGFNFAINESSYEISSFSSSNSNGMFLGNTTVIKNVFLDGYIDMLITPRGRAGAGNFIIITLDINYSKKI
jgi:hypothetical protein